MNITPEEYNERRKAQTPNSAHWRNCTWAFLAGGTICTIGETFRTVYGCLGFGQDDVGLLTSGSLILLSAILTALGWYQKIAAHAGAGTLVPITGFANAVVSPAIEFKVEGFVTGVGAKMFIIAGPVIVYGTLASVIWGVVYYAICWM